MRKITNVVVSLLFYDDQDPGSLESRAASVLEGVSGRRFGKSQARRSSYFAGRAALAAAFDRLELAATVSPHPDFGYLAVSQPGWFANISHTDRAAVAAVARAPVGIDIESRDRDASRALQRVATEEELANAPSGIALWSAKEAFSKALGLGIKFGLHAFEIDFAEQEPHSGRTPLNGPLKLLDPALRIIHREGFVIALCGERESLAPEPEVFVAS